MADKTRAAFWWIDRWRKSTAYTDMTLAEQGAYRNLLDELWLRDGLLPLDERILAKISGDALEWANVRKAVLARFTRTADGYRHETHDEVSSQGRTFRDAQSDAAKRRWEKVSPEERSERAKQAAEKGWRTRRKAMADSEPAFTGDACRQSPQDASRQAPEVNAECMPKWMPPEPEPLPNPNPTEEDDERARAGDAPKSPWPDAVQRVLAEWEKVRGTGAYEDVDAVEAALDAWPERDLVAVIRRVAPRKPRSFGYVLTVLEGDAREKAEKASRPSPKKRAPPTAEHRHDPDDPYLKFANGGSGA